MTAKQNAKPTCQGCGHAIVKHRRYARGVNRHGSPWVCIVDGCRHWQECRFAEQAGKRPA